MADTQAQRSATLTQSEMQAAKSDPVNFLFGKLQEKDTGYCLDGDGLPCLEISDDPDKKLYRLLDDQGRPTQRARSFLRSMYRYVTGESLHLGKDELVLLVDYLVEEAFRGGRKVIRTEPAKDRDYNFEAVVVFANSLRPSDDPVKGLGNGLLEDATGGVKEERLRPRLAYDARSRSLVAEMRTADLWRAINSPQVEVQVQADKQTLFKAINFFSRRLAELEEQFRGLGIGVALCHKDSGSWVTITRSDEACPADPTVLVTPDGSRPSSSGEPSGRKSHDGKALDATDDNRIEVEESEEAVPV